LSELLLPAILIVVLTGIAFSPAVKNEFLNWDDDSEITGNQQVQSLSLDNIKQVLASPRTGLRPEQGIYHPLTTLSWALEYRFFKYNPEVFHADNIVLHAMNALLALWLAFLISGEATVAFVVGVLFAVHPLRVESVAWATERKDVLYGFFYLLSLICYLYYVQRSYALKYYALALLCMALSAFAKGMAASLPLALISLDFLFSRKADKRAVLEKLPFFALALIFGVVAIEAQRFSGWVANPRGLSLAHRASYASYALFVYLEKLLFPVGLSAIYPHPEKVPWIIPLLLLAICAWVIHSVKKTRKVAFGFMFFLATIVMVLPWVGVGKFVAADRLSYIPLFGPFYLAGEGFHGLIDSSKQRLRPYRKFFYAALIGLIVTYSALSHERCKVWRNSYVLMSDVIEKHPRVPDAYINRAMVARNDVEALADYTKAIEYDPSRVVVYNNRGLLYYHRGEYGKAIQDYDEGIRRDPTYALLYFNRMVYHFYHKKDYALAWADLKRAEGLGVRMDPKLKEKIEKSYKPNDDR
jgi:tetratricopeptide (TPR) repeat protein